MTAANRKASTHFVINSAPAPDTQNTQRMNASVSDNQALQSNRHALKKCRRKLTNHITPPPLKTRRMQDLDVPMFDFPASQRRVVVQPLIFQPLASHWSAGDDIEMQDERLAGSWIFSGQSHSAAHTNTQHYQVGFIIPEPMEVDQMGTSIQPPPPHHQNGDEVNFEALDPRVKSYVENIRKDHARAIGNLDMRIAVLEGRITQQDAHIQVFEHAHKRLVPRPRNSVLQRY